jgi:hypothetical protein
MIMETSSYLPGEWGKRILRREKQIEPRSQQRLFRSSENEKAGELEIEIGDWSPFSCSGCIVPAADLHCSTSESCYGWDY